jgi:acetyl esterase
MHSTDELRIGALGTRVRVHRPTPAAAPGLIYIHGGGWTMFSLDTHDRVMRERGAGRGGGRRRRLQPVAGSEISARSTSASTSCRRCAAQKCPASTPRAWASAASSAGANLSVATNLRLRERGEPVLAAMLLNYGAFDDRHTASYRRYDGERYMLTADEMDGFWRNYIRTDRDRDDPLVCPLRANLRGLPPAFVAIAECDILADQDRLMVDRLRAAGSRSSRTSTPARRTAFSRRSRFRRCPVAPTTTRRNGCAAARGITRSWPRRLTVSRTRSSST